MAIHLPSAIRWNIRDVLRRLRNSQRLCWSCLPFPAPDTAPTAHTRGFWLALVGVMLAAGALLLSNLSYPLLEPDEGRHAEIGREMLQSGDWIVPALHTEPYFDKPALFYWLLAGSYQLFGVAESSARLVPALAAWLTVLGVFLCGRRVAGTRAGVLAAAALLLMPGFGTAARLVLIDSVLTCCVTWAAVAGYIGLQARQGRAFWWALSCVACALGILAKGPIAVILVAPPLAMCWRMNRDHFPIRAREVLIYAGLVALLVCPWFVLMAARQPDYLHYFFVEQNLARFLHKGYHDKPLWYFLPVLLVGCGPWSFLLIPFVRYVLSREPELARLRPRGMGLWLLWAGWCVLFFSMSSGKLATYILPALPALALLAGVFLDQVLFTRLRAGCIEQARGLAARMAIVGLALGWLAAIATGWRWLHFLGPVSAAVQASLAVLCAAAALAGGRRLAGTPAWALCGGVALALVLLSTQVFLPGWAQRRAVMQSAEVLKLLRSSEVGVVCSGCEWGSVPFYAGRNDRIVFWQDQTPAQVHHLLRGCARLLVVARHADDMIRCQGLLPLGHRLRKLAQVDDLRVLTADY